MINNIKNTICILSPPTLENLAIQVKNICNLYFQTIIKIGRIDNNFINEMNKSNCLGLIIGFQSYINSPMFDFFKNLNYKNYILLQVEQINTISKFNKLMNSNILNFMKRALLILDYSKLNTNLYNFILNKNLINLPINLDLVEDNNELKQ